MDVFICPAACNSASRRAIRSPTQTRTWTSGWWNPTIHIYPDGNNIDPATVVHEWWHASHNQGQPLIPLWIGANNTNALFTHDNQGFLDWWAESAAQNIVSTCGVK